LPATVFGKIVNRVLFPVMAQVQDERERLAGGYERSLAIVSLISLPVSSFLWIIAPEFIPVLLGPKWTSVVLPFRLFTCGLFFRMSSKVSDACTKAAGAVYYRALIQGIYAVTVLLGALAGQRWGIGGVAVAVSIAMGINWLTMAALGRSVTGLSWPRFVRSQAPGLVLAVVVAVATVPVVEMGRAIHLAKLPIMIAAGSAAGLVTYAAAILKSDLLGPHGNWAFKNAALMLRRVSQVAQGGLRRTGMPSVGKPSAKP
jgi:O-antigen/teichoic acid export membrane protein